jgi:hypothetical protein
LEKVHEGRIVGVGIREKQERWVFRKKRILK